MDGKDLNGTNRFVLDGLATEQECLSLLKIAEVFAEDGDGYKGTHSPHTKLELFAGLTLRRVAILVHLGIMQPKQLALFLQITEHARNLLVEQFDLKRKLYFTYTHLVCRSALPNAPKNRTDLSHAIHADNCNLLKNGLCEKLPPSYIWRDYSAIVYLNSNFEGGDFIFAADSQGKKVQSLVRPKCGRMVGFSSGFENLHGVKAVKKGTRCALALWFTFEARHAESDRMVASQFAQQVERRGIIEDFVTT